MLSREVVDQEAAANVVWIPVTKEDISRVAARLRHGEIGAREGDTGKPGDAVERAAIIRLQAAGILGLGSMLDGFEDASLAGAIAAASLTDIGGYYYFDPEELLGHAAVYEAMHRIEIRLKAREAVWGWSSRVQVGANGLPPECDSMSQ
jgi:hypothetical protein